MNSKQKDETDLLEDLSDHSESATENMESIVNLDEFSGELTLETAEMDTEESELIGAASMEEEHEEELFENEIASHEVEIPSDDQEMPEKKLKTTPASSSSSSVPPLRLLNIAPKPDHQSPLSVKSINGQQVILVPGAQTSGQTIKFVSPQGQEINLANLSLNRPTIALKQTGSKISLAGNSASVLQQQSSTTIQPKQIIMKKVINATNSSSTGKVISKPTITVNNNKPGQQQQKQFVVVQKSNNEVIHHPPQKIKFVQSVAGSNISAASGAVSKTITMQQAQQLGLFGNNKLFQNNLQSSVQSAPKRTVLINKSLPKTIKIVPQIATTNQIVHNTASVSTTTSTTTTTGNNIKTIPLGQVKSPTKILPATSSFTVMPGTGIKPPQKIILKSSGGSQVLSAGQLIQVAGTQGLANGQIHQINVPGKGIQYIKFVAATTASDSTKNSIINTVKTTITTTTTVPDKKPVLAAPKFVTKPNTAKTTQLMIVPAGYLPATVVQPLTQKLQISSMKVGAQNKSISAPNKASSAPSTASPSAETSAVSPNDSQSVAASNTSLSTSTIASNGIRPRKPCNCAKSQCLKLYCDCFANGEFCYLCNCMNCFNNLDNEESRNLAIKACLERNSQAFRPKIGKAKDTTGDVLRKHTKGCNCKRSGCLKNYCECYEAKIACSGNCKCVSCRNTEDGIERRANEASSAKLHQISDEELVQAVYANLPPSYHHKQSHLSRSKKPNNSKKQAISFITDDVIEATCECLLTISDDADSNQQDEEITKQQIIEEFGVCLSDIISCSLNKRNNTAS